MVPLTSKAYNKKALETTQKSDSAPTVNQLFTHDTWAGRPARISQTLPLMRIFLPPVGPAFLQSCPCDS